MKNLLIVFLSCLLLAGTATSSQAAFIFKRKHKSDTTASAAKEPVKHSKKWERKHERKLDREREWRREHAGEEFMYHEKEAKISLRFMLWGLLLAPLGIPAIVHAIRSIKKKEWYYKYTVIACLIFGSLEILLLILGITILLFALL